VYELEIIEDEVQPSQNVVRKKRRRESSQEAESQLFPELVVSERRPSINERIRCEADLSFLRQLVGDQLPSKDPPPSQPTQPAASLGATASVPRAATVSAASASHSVPATVAQLSEGEIRRERFYPGTTIRVTTAVREPSVTVPVDPPVERSAYRHVVAPSLPQPPRREDQSHRRAMSRRRQWSLGRPLVRRRSVSPSDLYPASTTRMFEECDEFWKSSEYRRE